MLDYYQVRLSEWWRGWSRSCLTRWFYQQTLHCDCLVRAAPCHLITFALFEWVLIMKPSEDLLTNIINCVAGVDWPFSLHTLDYILCSISGAWPLQRWSSLMSPVFTQFPSSYPGHYHTLCHPSHLNLRKYPLNKALEYFSQTRIYLKTVMSLSYW